MKYLKSTLLITAITLLNVGCANANPTQHTLTKSQLKALEDKHCNSDLLVYCQVISTTNGWSRLIETLTSSDYNQKTFEINPAGNIVQYSPSRPIEIIYPSSPTGNTNIPIKFNLNRGLQKEETLKLYKIEKNKKNKLVFELDSDFNNPIIQFETRIQLFEHTKFILVKTKNNQLISKQNFLLRFFKLSDSNENTMQKGNALQTYKVLAKRNKIRSIFHNDMKGDSAIESITYKSSEGDITLSSSILSSTPSIKFKLKNKLKDNNVKVDVKLINEKN